MEEYDLYRDIAERTAGDIYIGVVGPVRTGKSTFIRRMMDLLVLPNMEQTYEKERVVDELPQSGTGRTIMTTQPKFVPSTAVPITVMDKTKMRVRMVDCVGYMVRDARGYFEDEAPRMVRTPWDDQDVPFEEAAEMGTRKVINEHSTIGVLVTTDGTITDIPRPSYIEAEERVVREMKSTRKPFVVILNSATPGADDTEKLRESLSKKYDVPVVTLDVMNMSAKDVTNLLQIILYEFPIKRISMDIPLWILSLSPGHWLIRSIIEMLGTSVSEMERVRDAHKLPAGMPENEAMNAPILESINLANGAVDYSLMPKEGVFYRILGDECGYPIESDHHLVSIMKSLVSAKKEYDRIAEALYSVRETGYGLVGPSMDELKLEEPVITRHGGRFGVQLKASAPSLHLIRVDISTEVSPIVGTEKQSEELVQSLMAEFEQDPQTLWETELFGRSLHEMVREGLSKKLFRMPEDVQEKIQDALTRIINEGSGGIFCILI
jgi:stage IV sporulation protein A